MGVVLASVLVVGGVIVISGLFARRAGYVLAAPIVIAAIGAAWLFVALAHYERATGRELQGLIGYHYSVPEWGFKYAPGGRQIERWSFEIPAIVTFVMLLVSAIVATVRKRRTVGVPGTVALWLYHVGCAAAFVLVYALLWIKAASVFI